MTIIKCILKKKSKGFSLAEILVVISIIGILSAIGISSFQSTSQGSQFIANKTSLDQILNDYRYKAFVENKPYKLKIFNNTSNAVVVNLIEPDSTTWRDKSKMRRCDCKMGGDNDDTCFQAFALSETGQAPVQTKTIKNFKIKLCDSDSSGTNCNNETEDTVKICYLQDGTSPTDIFFKVHNIQNSISSIIKINKTGYAE